MTIFWWIFGLTFVFFFFIWLLGRGETVVHRYGDDMRWDPDTTSVGTYRVRATGENSFVVERYGHSDSPYAYPSMRKNSWYIPHKFEEECYRTTELKCEEWVLKQRRLESAMAAIEEEGRRRRAIQDKKDGEFIAKHPPREIPPYKLIKDEE
jgi:hypothetical protein